MGLVTELRADIEDCSKLLTSATRPANKTLLEDHLKLLTHRLDKATIDEKKKEEAKSAAATDKKVYTVQIRTYGWDQSDKFVKLYVTVDGITAADKDKVSCSFTVRGVTLTVSDVGGKNYQLVINNLAENISPDTSSFKAKEGTVVLLLAKAQAAQKWPAVTRQEAAAKEKEKKPDASADPGDSMMGLMKKMYDEGDDKMKQMLNKAWYEAQNKKGGGMPGMPGMGDMGDMGGLGDL